MSTTPTAEERASLRALCEAATMPPEPDHRGDCKCPECTAWVDRWAGAEDARAKVAAALPALLDALDAVERERASIECDLQIALAWCARAIEEWTRERDQRSTEGLTAAWKQLETIRLGKQAVAQRDAANARADAAEQRAKRLREVLTECVAALHYIPNGHHYCRGCDGGTANGWVHDPHCHIEEAMGLGGVSYPGPRFAINDAGRKALMAAAPLSRKERSLLRDLTIVALPNTMGGPAEPGWCPLGSDPRLAVELSARGLVEIEDNCGRITVAGRAALRATAKRVQ